MQIPKTPQEVAAELPQLYPAATNFNEATTRHRIIDVILHDVLAWPRSSVICEQYIDPGYADYVLLGRHGRQILFVEAKRSGHYFTLPKTSSKTPTRRVKIRSLITHADTAQALSQVRGYCINSGCEYAAITNGRQWIFFRTFEKNTDWEDIQAFVVADFSYFAKCYVEATNNFSYTAIVDEASLPQLLGTLTLQHREIFHPKKELSSYQQEVTANYLAPLLRPLCERFLGQINETDDEFIDRCYVSVREYHNSMRGVNQVIYDSLSPYFVNYNVKDFFDDKHGGAFGERIKSSVRERRTRDVIILFGGKGSGKSTFIRRLLYHRPPNAIKYFSKIAIIDLQQCPEDREAISRETWSQLLQKIDTGRFLGKDRESLLTLFADRVDLAKRQTLVGYSPSSEKYNSELNALVQTCLADKAYCAARLGDYWKRQQKGLIVVLDNTDQFSPDNQDYCFTLAQYVATRLDCLVVIAMREERFHYSKLHGTLDAFQNSGFHLSSPPPQMVFYKRLRYMLEILDSAERAKQIAPALTAERIEQIKQLLRVLMGEFRTVRSPLNQFLKACAHGNMRLSLDLFKQFLLSGYTRVDEMTRPGGWTLQTHQVLRPMMVPYRFFYDEASSSIPNVYQVRSEVAGSHFTALRLLGRLSGASSGMNTSLVPVGHLKQYFASNFNMVDDLTKNLNIFLATGIVESNNRVDEYSESIDSIRITPYGMYIVDQLAPMFSYLDLVSLDCAVHDEGIAHSLANLANEDLRLFYEFRKRDRIEVRLKRVSEFVEYLRGEEEREFEVFSLPSSEKRFIPQIIEKLEGEMVRIRASAERHYGAASAETSEGDIGW